jgi:hypothetical protein
MSVVYSKDVAAGQIQLATVESPVVDIHQRHDHAVTDLPQVEDGVVQIGDRVAKRLGCRKEFGSGVAGIVMAMTPTPPSGQRVRPEPAPCNESGQR